MKSIVVTGATGQLGTAFRRRLPDSTFLTRADFDMADRGAMRPVLDKLAPDVVINCAAYTTVDRAEEEEALATRINGHAVGEMAEFCAVNGSLFITYSTDYVFDGQSTRPWVESDPAAPINAYGRSKRLGEELALERGGLVVRTSWLVSSTHANFVATMLRLGQQQDLRVVNDQRGSPTVVDDLAAATVTAMTAGATGILHLVNGGETTWYGMARHALRIAGLDPDRVSACPTSEYPTAARRPEYSVLGSERLGGLGISPLPTWEDSLVGVVEGLFENGVVDRQ